jgi:hypothetical protein
MSGVNATVHLTRNNEHRRLRIGELDAPGAPEAAIASSLGAFGDLCIDVSVNGHSTSGAGGDA